MCIFSIFAKRHSSGHFLDLVYFITRNCEIDCRAGIGLNEHADGYLVGSGFSVRY